MKIHAAESKCKAWRDVYKIHPRANKYPLLDREELIRLGKDIKKNGLRFPAKLGWYDGAWVLCDGRSRLDGMEGVGIDIDLSDPDTFQKLPKDTDLDAWIDSANLHRHLSREWVETYLADLIKQNSDLSARAISAKAMAGGVKIDKNKVSEKRKQMESTGETPPVEKRIGADGKARKLPTRSQPANPDPKPELSIIKAGLLQVKSAVERMLRAKPRDRDHQRLVFDRVRQCLTEMEENRAHPQ